jgi:HNH endonuclease
MDYWGARCPITGITDPALLRASHIVPWAECGDAQRLDVHNGLLVPDSAGPADPEFCRQLERRADRSAARGAL